MIKHPELLSLNDKIYMIYNKKCFTNSTRSFINFNKSEWMSEIESNIPTDKIKEMEESPNKIRSVLFTKLANVGDPESTKKFINNICDNIFLETPENIVDFLSYTYNTIQHFKKKWKITDNDISMIYNVIYSLFIPWKITANVIHNKTLSEIRAADEGLNHYLNNINRLLFKEIGTSREPSASAVVIYLLMDNLKLNKNDESVINFLLDGKKYFNKEDSSATKKYLLQLLNGKETALSVIDKVTINNLGEYGDNILKFSKRKIEDNYIKSKISNEVNNETLCIGEDIFPDHEPMNLGFLLVEIDKLNDDSIKSYVGKDAIITYAIDDKEVGYIKKEEKLPVCKILRKEKGFLTLTKMNNISYLLFKIYGDKKLYGISFPSSNGGQRKLMELDIPNNFTI